MSFFKKIHLFKPLSLPVWGRLFVLLVLLICRVQIAEPSYLPTVGSNIGIGTSTPVGALTVMNGNVGIGTWSPTQRLQVVGTVVATAFSGDGSLLTGVNAGGWTDAGALVYTTTTTDSVGIGSTAPGAKLDIVGDVPQLRIAPTAGQSTYVFLNKTDNFVEAGITYQTGGVDKWNIFSDNDFPNSTDAGDLKIVSTVSGETDGFPRIQFPISNTNIYLALSGGNVGVGTSIPVGGLVVMNGNAGIGTWSPIQRLQVIGTVNATAFVGDGSGLTNLPSTSGWTDGGSNVYTTTVTDNVAIGTTTPASTLTLSGNLSVGSSASYRAIVGPANGMAMEGNVGIGTWAANQKVVIMGGNVGIGTLNPQAQIEMGGTLTATASNQIYKKSSFPGVFQSAGQNAMEAYGLDISARYFTGGGLAGIYYGIYSAPSVSAVGGGAYLYGIYSNPTVTNTTSLTKVFSGVFLGGNVGVGTLEPNSRLVVNGGVSIGTFLNSSFVTTTAPSGGLIVENNVGIGTSLPVGALTVMNGNVGIGTWSPTARLQVVGTVNATAFVGDGSGLTGVSAGSSGWSDGGTNVYTSTTTDNVGIGTSTPTAVLLVENAGTQTSFRVNDVVADPSPFIIDEAGNVGIGTTNPTALVHAQKTYTGVNAAQNLLYNYYSVQPSADIDTSSYQYGNKTEMWFSGANDIGPWAASAIYGVSYTNMDAAATSANLAGVTGSALQAGDGFTTDMRGVYAEATKANIGGVGNMFGVYSVATNQNATNSVLGLYGGSFNAISTGSVTSTTMGAVTSSISVAAGATVVTAKGISTDVTNSGTINDAYGLYVGSVQGTNKWSMYASDTAAPSYFAGHVGLGTTAPVGALAVMNGNVGIGTWSPTQRLQVVGTVSATAFSGDGSALTNLPASGGWIDGGTIVYTATTTDNVGIGTTTPTMNLEVVSKIVARTNGSGTYIAAQHSQGDGYSGAVNAIINGEDTVGAFHAGLYSGSNTTGNWFALIGQRMHNSAWNNSSPSALGTGYYLPGIAFAGQTDGNPGTGMIIGAAINGIVDGTVASGALPSAINFRTSLTDSNGLIERMRITSSGNVGIGTTAPVGALTVMNGNVGIGTWSPTSRLQVVGTVAATAFTGDGSGLTGVSANSGWTDGGTNVYTTTTTDKVAIGTTTPASTLMIAGNIGLGTTLPYRTFAGPNNGMIVEGNVGIGTWNPLAKLQVTGTAVADNIGIGITAPLAALEISKGTSQMGIMVAGNGGYLSATPYTSIEHSFGADYSSNINAIVGGGDTVGGFLAGMTQGGTVGNMFGFIGATQGTSLWNDVGSGGALAVGNYIPGLAFAGQTSNVAGQMVIAGAINGVVDGTVSTNVLPTAINFRTSLTDSTGLTERMRITSQGNIGIGTTNPRGALAVMNGNVGIGTWSPTSRLQVVGTIVATAFSGDGSALTNLPTGGGWTDGGTNVYTTTTTDTVGIGTTTPNAASLEIVKQGTTPPLKISSSASGNGDYIIVTTSGNIGMGTLNPGSVLSIVRNVPGSSDDLITLQNTNNGGYSVIKIRDDAGVARGSFGYANSGANLAPTDLYWAANDTTTWLKMLTNNTLRMAITSTGDIGIGTSAPVNGTAIMNGNVGIGTWNPGSMLMIKGGNVGIGTTTPYLRIAAPTNGMAIEGNVGIGTWAAANGKLIVMGGNVGIGTTTPVGAFTVMNGNVGIGTWSPGNLLSVAGTIYANAINSDNAVFGNASGGVGVTGNSSTSNAGLFISSNAGNTSTTLVTRQAAASTANLLEVQNASNVPMVAFTSSGNVGMGTTAPVGALSVMAGNVGIGTWSPTSRLQVVGTVNATAFVGDGSGLTGISANSGWTDGGTNVYTSTTTDLVAVGTTTPASALTVRGNVGIGTTTPYTTIAASANGMIVEGNIGVGTFAASRGKIIVMGGNVGVGTITPGYSLEVSSGYTSIYGRSSSGVSLEAGVAGYNSSFGAGVYGASDQGNGVSASTNSGSSTAAGLLATSWGTGPAVYGQAWNGNSGYFQAMNNATTAATLVTQQQSALTADLFQVLNSSGGVLFDVKSTGNVGIGTWDASGGKLIITGGNVGIGTLTPVGALAVMSGNVGIGTWSPTGRLQVVGTVSATSFVGDGSGLTGISANSGWTDGGTNVYTSTTTDNVGVGTTTPTAALLVQNTGTQDSFRVNDAVTDGTPFIIDAAGNVGIGTTTMNTRLGVSWVSGDTTATSAFGALNPANDQVAVLAQSGSGGGVFGESVTYIGVNGYSNSSSGVKGESASGLGVEGASDSNNSGLFRARVTGNTAATLVTKQNGAGNADLFQAQNDSAVSLVNITSAGNVGLGTSTPVGALTMMNGNVGIGTWSPTSGIQFKSSFAVYRTSTAASATTAGQTIIGVTSTAAPRTITLATADVKVGRVVIIKDESGGAATNNITVTTEAGQTIDGAASVIISANYGVLRVYSDGTNWYTF